MSKYKLAVVVLLFIIAGLMYSVFTYDARKSLQRSRIRGNQLHGQLMEKY